MVHKVDALLWALSLEVNTGDLQESIRGYCHSVICNLSDQGILFYNGLESGVWSLEFWNLEYSKAQYAL